MPFVIALQHLMGLVMAALTYILLRQAPAAPPGGARLLRFRCQHRPTRSRSRHFVLSDAFFGLLYHWRNRADAMAAAAAAYGFAVWSAFCLHGRRSTARRACS